MRFWIGRRLVMLGMAILPSDVRSMMIKMIMYHVPGGLTEAERAEVREAKVAWIDAKGRTRT